MDHKMLSATLLLLSASSIAAQNELSSIYDLTLKELMEVTVVTAASGYEQALERAPSNAMVISREQWETRGAYTLSEALEAVSGVHISESKQNFTHNIYMIRGLSGDDGKQIKVLIDGRPSEWMQSGGRPFGFEIPLSMFERIEVIKGPGSAIYGADAFGGVINLVSRKGKMTATELSVALGSFDTQLLSFNGSVKQDAHELDLALAYRRTDDDPGRVVSRDLQTTFDEWLGTSASNAPGPIDEHSEILSLMANWRWHHISLDVYTWRNFDVGTAGGVAQALDDEGSASSSIDQVDFNWDLSEQVSLGKLDFSVSYNKSTMKSHLYVFPAGSRFPIGSDGNVQFADPQGETYFPDGLIGAPGNVGEAYHTKLTWLGKKQDHLLRWELGFEYQDFHAFERKNFGPGVLDGSQSEVDDTLMDVTGTELLYLPDISRRFYYLSLLDEWQINEQTILNLGIRYDRYSDFGSTTNPRVSLIYNSSVPLSTKLFFGSAFRAPAFLELYVRNNPVVKGNPNLNPEGIKTYEVGLGFDYWVHDNLLLSLDMFNYYADDLVAFVFDREQNFEVAQNIGIQKGSGGEFSIGWRPTKLLGMNLNYSYIRSEDGNDSAIAGVPGQMLYLDFNYRFGANWHWYIDGKWIKDRKRGSADLRPAMKDYFKVNTTLTYSGLLTGLDISLVMKNLFDRASYEPSDGSIPEDYPQPGRQYLVRFHYRF